MKRFVILACTALCLGLSTPSRAQLTPDFCGGLDGIADGWRNLFPLGDATTCPDLCKAWARSCHGAVGAAKRCTLGILEQIAVVARAQCTTEPTPTGRATCHRTFRAGVDALKAETKLLAEEAYSSCADAETMDECLATCQSLELGSAERPDQGNEAGG